MDTNLDNMRLCAMGDECRHPERTSQGLPISEFKLITSQTGERKRICWVCQSFRENTHEGAIRFSSQETFRLKNLVLLDAYQTAAELRIGRKHVDQLRKHGVLTAIEEEGAPDLYRKPDVKALKLMNNSHIINFQRKAEISYWQGRINRDLNRRKTVMSLDQQLELIDEIDEAKDSVVISPSVDKLAGSIMWSVKAGLDLYVAPVAASLQVSVEDAIEALFPPVLVKAIALMDEFIDAFGKMNSEGGE